MSTGKITDEFTRGAVAQITERGDLAVVIDLYSRSAVRYASCATSFRTPSSQIMTLQMS